jgi:hypothetical protein
MGSLKMQNDYFILFLGKTHFYFTSVWVNVEIWVVLKFLKSDEKSWKIIAFLTKFLKLQQATTLKIDASFRLF